MDKDGQSSNRNLTNGGLLFMTKYCRHTRDIAAAHAKYLALRSVLLPLPHFGMPTIEMVGKGPGGWGSAARNVNRGDRRSVSKGDVYVPYATDGQCRRAMSTCPTRPLAHPPMQRSLNLVAKTRKILHLDLDAFGFFDGAL